MSLSHLSLTVVDLPTATAFFAACLKPLGYKFLGRDDESIGFGQKNGEPAEFWITEQKPGYVSVPISPWFFGFVLTRCRVPAGAAHLAFLAPSKDAVGNFFLGALKAGGKLHGEPKMRDSQSRYYSAAVIDADGNSVEAVYCPGNSSARSEVSGAGTSTVDDRSFVSKAYSRASSARPESTISMSRSDAKSYASRGTTAVDRGSSVAPSARASPASRVGPGTQVAQKPDESASSNPTARTIVGSLIGAAAGAAIAYAWTGNDKGEESQTEPARAPQYSPGEWAPREEQPQSFRAIENGRPPLARSMTSRGPRSTFDDEGSEFAPLSEKMSDMYIEDNGRRASDGGSVFSSSNKNNKDIPLRALEYSPSMWEDDNRSAASSAVRSYVDNDKSSVYSASTAKPSKANHSSSGKSKSKSGGSSARIPSVPEESVASFSSYRTGATSASKGTKSTVSAARHVPLPESVVGVDVDTNVTPDDSISQVPINDYDDERSTYSRRSSSKAGGGGGGGSSRSRASNSKRSSTFDEPVRPGDSASQVSCNTKGSERTVKAGGGSSRMSSSRRAGQAV